MSKKSKRPPVDIKIQWTEDESNPGGKEPSKKLMMEFAKLMGRRLAQQHIEEIEARDREVSARIRELSDALDELLASVTVTDANAPETADK